jgi:hypothetical protein
MSKNILNEVNTIREQMGLPLLNENELLHLELSKIDLDPLNEGWWENAKYALSKLGRYKAGGKIFGKTQTDAKANAQIMALLDKKGNEMIKQLDSSIKAKNPEFPNNKSQEQYLTTILDIATVYDSVVAATKLKPDDAGFLPVDAANAIIEDLRAYTQKYLDVDLTAAFSVFNEAEEGAVEEEMVDEAIKNVDGKEISSRNYKAPGIPVNVEVQSDSPLNIAQDKVSDKFAGTKNAIKKGDLEAYGTERMKTLRSWRMPLALMGTGASFGALSWLIQYLYGPKEIVESSRDVIESKAEQALGNIKPGEGMTQIMNRTLGTSLSPSSNPNDVVSALAKIGGGDANKGVEIITQNGGIFRDPGAARETLSQIVANPTEHGNNLKQVFSGTWAGTGKMAGDTLVTQNGGTLKQMVITSIVKWTTKTTIKTTAAATIAAPILKVLGVALLAGGAVAALSRYKGRKSSRAQVLNDLVQYLRPVEGTKDNQEVIDNNDGGDKGQGGGDGQGGGKSGSDNQLYNYLKKYFQDLYNFRSQVNTDTYGKGGSGNAQKTYSGGGTINKNVVAPNDVDDLLKLMEEFEMVSEETLDDIGLSSNQLKLFRTNLQRLTQLIKMVNKFSSEDKNLARLIDSAKGNPVSTADINSMLESDPKSLKIFVSDFNKALYSIEFKNGNSIIDQLSKIQVNKLQEDELVDEKAEREQPKGAMNKIYNDRRAFLGNLQGYIKTLYSIFSYLIDKMKSNPEGNKEAQADYLTGQKGGKNSPGLTSTDKTQMNKGLNATQVKGSLRDVGKNLEEGKRYTKEELSEMSIDMEENINPKTEAMLNSVNGKIFTQLAKVVPELSTRIATAYQQEYNETINKARLGKFLETVLGALATVPQQRMVQIINRGDVDITAYKRMLKDLKSMEGEGGDQPVQATASSFNPSSPEKFLPVNVGEYDLAGQKNSFRTGLAQKAAEIISRQTDVKLDEKNMLAVMKQLIDTLNSKHGGNIPKAQ